MKNKIYLSILLIIICESSLFGQLKYTFTQFGNETWDFVKQPGKWDGNDILTMGLLSAGTFLLMETADQPVRSAVLKDQKYFKSVPIEFGRIYGELYSPVILFGGFAIHSLIADDIGTRKIAYEIGQASLYAGAIDYILKVAIGRARPYYNEGPNSFHPFSAFFTQEYHSIPGGHSAAAFVLSTVLSRNAKPVWLKVLAYLPAVLTFVSRVYQDQHWTSDDFLGAALGYFVATWVVDQHENNKSLIEISSPYPLSIRIAL
ncbi:MAG: phosphatase PAP2 family protein [Ignavibacteriales bacterium]|nr:phosphatase PAP2 family protein [Ignavibacteriales bacterium]